MLASWSGFISRHRWSLPATLLSAGFFARLATELRENELGPFDAAAAQLLANARGRLDGVMLFLTELGRGWSLLLLGTACCVPLLLLRRGREVVFLATVGAGCLLIVGGLKVLFQRARPGPAGLYLLTTPHSFSFPSGHALASSALFFSLVVVARVTGGRGLRVVVLACTAALLSIGISASRVYFGVHFPSDVVGGILAGIAWASAVAGWFYPRVLPGEASSPAA